MSFAISGPDRCESIEVVSPPLGGARVARSENTREETMQIPLQITFRNMDPSPAIEANVREHAGRLERFFDRTMSCRVAIEAPHRQHRKGRLYKIHIDLKVPGGELAVSHEGPQDHAHEDISVAIRDAFNAVSRRLQDHARKVRGDVKRHESPMHGKVTGLFHEDGYGFIETTDGTEVYFHKNSVANGAFDRLSVGDEVRVEIVTKESAQNPQATTVKWIGKHHIVE
jgi:cold shock CspA family protein/ribosome-associated translation inhibitor RaiA